MKHLDFFDLLQYCGVPKRIRQVLKDNQGNFPFYKPQDLYIYGGVGAGKTCLAAWILSQSLLQEKPNISFYRERMTYNGNKYDPNYKPKFHHLFLNVPEFLQEIKNSFGTNEKIDIKPYMNAHLLVLDDLGSLKTTDWVYNTLYLIINHRYNEMLPTIFTSNLSPTELEKEFTDSRIISRIIHSCKVVKLKNIDLRKEVK